jgi:lipopolysaccharide export LptBFGC system permease protein LptF
MVGESIGSFFVGTLGLSVLLVISGIIAFLRKAPRTNADLKLVVLVAICCRCG